jgi:hypothetical protein
MHPPVLLRYAAFHGSVVSGDAMADPFCPLLQVTNSKTARKQGPCGSRDAVRPIPIHVPLCSLLKCLSSLVSSVQGAIVASLVTVPALDAARVITDSHFVTRDRMGRMVTFAARIAADG